MASNRLEANPTKTSFIMINDKEEGAKTRKIIVGNVEISQESSAKLLGITMDKNKKMDYTNLWKGRYLILSQLKDVRCQENTLRRFEISYTTETSNFYQK